MYLCDWRHRKPQVQRRPLILEELINTLRSFSLESRSAVPRYESVHCGSTIQSLNSQAACDDGSC